MSLGDSILFPKGRKVSDRRYHEAGVRGRYEKNLRIIRGHVDTTTPTILSGVGFTVVRYGAGRVTVTFSPAFSAAPSVVSMVDRAVGPTARIVYALETVTASTVKLERINISDAYVDGTLYFVAIGPA